MLVLLILLLLELLPVLFLLGAELLLLLLIFLVMRSVTRVRSRRVRKGRQREKLVRCRVRRCMLLEQSNLGMCNLCLTRRARGLSGAWAKAPNRDPARLPHSYRSAARGSMLAARRAGM